MLQSSPGVQSMVQLAVVVAANAKTRVTASLLIRPDMTTPFCPVLPWRAQAVFGPLIVVR